MENLAVVFEACPGMLLWVVAIVIAVVRWQNHPLASALLLTGGVVELMLRAAYVVVPRMMIERHLAAPTLSIVYGVLSLVGVGASALIVAAVFVERGPKDRAPVDPKML
jgi:hypothetical protein